MSSQCIELEGLCWPCSHLQAGLGSGQPVPLCWGILRAKHCASGLRAVLELQDFHTWQMVREEARLQGSHFLRCKFSLIFASTTCSTVGSWSVLKALQHCHDSRKRHKEEVGLLGKAPQRKLMTCCWPQQERTMAHPMLVMGFCPACMGMEHNHRAPQGAGLMAGAKCKPPICINASAVWLA